PDAKSRAESAAKHRLMDVPRGLSVRIHLAPIQRAPHPVRPARRVSDEHMRVNLRIASAAGAVQKGCRHEPGTGHDLMPAGAHPGSACMTLEVRQSRSDRLFL